MALSGITFNRLTPNTYSIKWLFPFLSESKCTTRNKSSLVSKIRMGNQAVSPVSLTSLGETERLHITGALAIAREMESASKNNL